MEKLVGKRYAEALFEAGIELKKLDEFKNEIEFVSEVFKSDDQLKTVFQHPKLSKNEKKDILNSLFKDKVSTEVLNLCYITVDKGREKHLEVINDEYRKLYNKEKGIVEAQALTAVAMSKEELDNLQSKLSNKLNKKVELKNAIDPTVVGGVLVKVGDKIIDGSIKGRLNEVYRNLNNMKLTRKQG